MTDLQVWVRVGDQDDYHAFDSPELAAEHVHEYLHWPGFENNGYSCSCNHEVERFTGRGLVGIELLGTPYISYNGISLYWGTPNAQLYTPLSDLELDAFSNSLQ